MVADKVDLWNMALGKLGSLRVQQSEEETEHARQCRTFYDTNRRAVLEAHPWNFAIKRAVLEVAPDDDQPAFGYSTALLLPEDFLRAVETDLFPDNQWAIENGLLLCDDDELNLRYVYDCEDTLKFSALYEDALTTKMAHDMCQPLTQSTSTKDALWKEFEKKISLARSIDAQQGSGQRVTAARWQNARRRGR